MGTVRITDPINLARVRRLIKQGADRAAYIKLPKKKREKYVAAYKSLVDDNTMPKKNQFTFDLVKFSYLCELMENSLSPEHQDQVISFAATITKILTFRMVKLGEGLAAIIRPGPSSIVFNPIEPSLRPMSMGEDTEDADNFLT